MAVIFDMDGVLADTEPIHQMALEEVLARRGHRIGVDEYAKLVGLGHHAAWGWIRRRFHLAEDQAAYDAEYEATLLPLLGADTQPAPGVLELISTLRAEGVLLAVASSSNRSVVAATLDALGLSSAFAVTVSGNEVSRGKPDPEIFLLAARRLGVSPSECVVIEDSPHGMRAARAAGMRVVAITSRYTQGVELPADVIVSSVVELTLAGSLVS